MKRLYLAFGCIAALAATSVSLATTPVVPLSWEEQNRAMLFLIMDLSSINAINGINLTRDQALKLREMASQVQAASPTLPDLKAGFRPDLGEVRDTYCKVREVLLAGKDVPDALEKQVGTARAVEASVIRQSLAKPKTGAQGCVRCHGQPASEDLRGLSMLGALAMPNFSRGYSQTEAFLAHANGLAGWQGLFKMFTLGSRVEAILTPEQKEIFTSFSCCLTPPKSLKDPMRAGQASGGEQEIGLLRYIRTVANEKWPVTRLIMLEVGKGLLVAKSPDISEPQKAQIARRVGEVFDKARKLSDSDFELTKDQLAGEIQKSAGLETENTSDKDKRNTAALFLLGPGTVEAYDNLLRRLDVAQKASR